MFGPFNELERRRSARPDHLPIAADALIPLFARDIASACAWQTTSFMKNFRCAENRGSTTRLARAEQRIAVFDEVEPDNLSSSVWFEYKITIDDHPDWESRPYR